MVDGGEEQKRKWQKNIAADISNRRVEAPQDADDIIAAEPEEDEEELVPNQGEGEEQEQPAVQPPQRVQQTPAEQLEKGQVPKYEAEPPEAYKQPPGGPAVRPKIPFDPKEKREEFKEHARKQAKKELAQAGKEIASKAGQAMKEAAVKAAQAIAKAVAAAARQAAVAVGAFLAEGGWVPVLIILILVGLTIAAFALLGNMRSRGSTIVQAADILDDHPLIKTVLSLSNPADFQKLLDENKAKLSDEISSFENELNSKYSGDSRTGPTIDKLNEVLKLIAAYTTPNAAKAKEIRDKLVAAVKPWSVTLNPGGMIFPATGFRRNNIIPGSDYRTPHRPNHRGIDIGMSIGTPYRSAASGTIVYLEESIADANEHVDLWHNGQGEHQNSGFGNTIIIKLDQPVANGSAAYFEIHHLMQWSASSFGLKVGSHVNQGDFIGKSGHNGTSTGPHCHFQVDKTYCSGPCGQGRESDTIDPKIPLGW